METNPALILAILEYVQGNTDNPRGFMADPCFEEYPEAEVNAHLQICRTFGWFVLNRAGFIQSLTKEGYAQMEALRYPEPDPPADGEPEPSE